ncbi:MAG: dihydroorotate dehydrogenase [Gemmatimonadota bacterium]
MTLEQELFGVRFQNPVLLAAGTCGFGEELAEVVDLERLGGLVTKSVTREPRAGNPAPRVAEFHAGMLNSIGLANPGVEAVRRDKLPWLRDHVRRAQVFVSVAGHDPEDFAAIVARLDDCDGFVGFEINLSCPNDTARGALPFALDPEALVVVVERVRARTQRPLWAKLAPNAPDPGASARLAVEAGADGVTMVNTLPGLQFDLDTLAPRLGAGPGGMSGPALLPVGVHAVWRARTQVSVPIVGAGGVATASDAAQYLLAGASLVQVGTASFADPASALRVVDGLARLGAAKGFSHIDALIGAGRTP